MDFLDLTLPTAEENLALDEALLLQAEAGRGGEALRLWEWPRPAVVLGSGCKLADDVDDAACLADGVPILRRSSGGGTVLLGQGCLCYSLVLAFARDVMLTDVQPSYRFILPRVIQALDVAGVVQEGISDLRFGAASSPATPSNASGITFCIMARSCLRSICRASGVTCVRRRGSRSIVRIDRTMRSSAISKRRALRSSPDCARCGRRRTMPGLPAAEVRRLVEEKYATVEWNRRR